MDELGFVLEWYNVLSILTRIYTTRTEKMRQHFRIVIEKDGKIRNLDLV